MSSRRRSVKIVEKMKIVAEKRKLLTTNIKSRPVTNREFGPAKRQMYSNEALINALHAIRGNHLSINMAAKKFQVPSSTLRRRISGKAPDEKGTNGAPPLLTKEMETQLSDWLVTMAKRGFLIRKEMILDTASVILDYQPKRWWYHGFLKRNPEISDLVNYTDTNKKSKITEITIRSWFDRFAQFLRENHLLDLLEDPKRIFVQSKTEFLLCLKTDKILGPKVHKTLTTEKEDMTILLTISADAKVAPPLVVYPYESSPDELCDYIPAGWILEKSEKGAVTSDIHFDYTINSLNNWLLKEEVQRPILLFIDGNKSHVTMGTFQWCEENHVILYGLPFSSGHVLHPTNGLIKPMKADFAVTAREWQDRPENMGDPVTKFNFCTLFDELLVPSPEFQGTVTNGFKESGLFPLNTEAPDYSKCEKE